MRPFRMFLFGIAVFICLENPAMLFAGVINPNISVLGQLISTRTDDAASEDARTVTFGLGETELVFDAYLNPYAKGFFVFAIGDEGFETEEAFITLFKGLPKGLALKAGKYRAGFGKLNPLHPHAYSFIEAPRVMAAMLPGEEGFNETGAQVSWMLPTRGSWASIVSADVIKGESFHPEETKSKAGWIGRWSNSFLIRDAAPLEFGISMTRGTNNIERNTQTTMWGADAKIKIPFSALTNLTLQGEYFHNSSQFVDEETDSPASTIRRKGFYAFGDLKFKQRWNAGVLVEQYEPDEAVTDKAVRGFVGYTLLEETTLFRLVWEKFMPQGSEDVHTWTFQVLFSMGPHKAHQF